MLKPRYGLLALCACFLAQPLQGQVPGARPHPDGHGAGKHVPLDSVRWSPARMGPTGIQMAIVHVDPETKATQIYVRLAPGARVPRHWHNANETLVVIRGALTMEHDSGERYTLHPGDLTVLPRRMVHRGSAGDEETILFVSMDGPWNITLVPDSVPAPARP